MEQNESHIISRILAGRTEEFAYFLNTYGQAVFALLVRWWKRKKMPKS